MCFVFKENFRCENGEVFSVRKSKWKKKKACTPRGPTATHTQCCLLRETLFQIFTFIILGKLFLFGKKSRPLPNLLEMKHV